MEKKMGDFFRWLTWEYKISFNDTFLGVTFGFHFNFGFRLGVVATTIYVATKSFLLAVGV